MAYGAPSSYADPTKVMGRRFAAALIDAIPAIIIGFIIVGHSLTRVDNVSSNFCDIYRATRNGLCIQPSNSSTAYYGSDFRTASVLFSLVYWFAVAGLLQGATGATFGKHMVGLRVVDRDGNLCGMGKALLRTLVGFGEVGFCFLIGGITALATHPHRRIGDFAAGTFVVAKESVGRPIGTPASAAYAPPWAPPGGPTGWGPPPSSAQPGWGPTTPPGSTQPAPMPGWGQPGATPPASNAPPTWGSPAANPPASQTPGHWGTPAPQAEPAPQPQPDPTPAPAAPVEPAPSPEPAQQVDDAAGWAAPDPTPTAAAEPAPTSFFDPAPQPAPVPEPEPTPESAPAQAPAEAAPPAREPQWDPQRNAWVFWEAETNRWLQHDPNTNTWGPLR